MDVCIIAPNREVSRFLKLTGEQHRLPGEAESETVGLCFDPSGTRLYFGSQRGFGFGVVYEVTGPFRAARSKPATPGAPLGLDVSKRLRTSKFLRRGLPVALTLDQAATVRLQLTAKLGDKRVILASEVREVGRGPETIALRPGKGLRKRLNQRRRIKARLVLRVETPGAPTRVLCRTVRLRGKRTG